MTLSLTYILSQILVIIYYIIYSYTFHLKNSNKILIYGIVATIISSVSYVLLNAYTGMAMCFVAVIRNLIFTKNKKNVLNLTVIILLTIIASAFTFNSYFCLFNIIATLIYTYALWQKNTKTYKLLGIIVNGLMIVYNVYIKSILGVILISIAFVNSIIGFLKESKKNMSKTKKSGPAIFMYCVIAITLVTAIVCFALYYGNINKNGMILWTGITAFTIMYHLWMRIIFGNVTKLFKLNYKQLWFEERKFEKKLYKILQVKKWKGKALTYNPELFSLKDYSLEEIANTMTKAETDHWINEIISLSTLLFAILWDELWIFSITAIVAMLFDAQFIVIQRYNRPRIVKILEKERTK